jgi:tyrosyl-tRNA synthetase
MEKEALVDEIVTRAVGGFIDPDGAFRKKLLTDPKKIIIKFGVDPTRPDLHLGHAVVLRKLRQLQDLGCKVVFLVGDITSSIGDPTGKSKIRPEISQAEINANMQTYLNQVGRILKTDADVFAWTRNSDWFVSINDIVGQEGTTISVSSNGQTLTSDPLPGDNILVKATAWVQTRMQKERLKNYTLINVLSVLRNISHSRLIDRDMFQERLKKNEPIFMHEMMYPVLQGIDSHAICDIFGACDLEIGGTDQYFNMLMGREVMQMGKQDPQAVMALKILEGTDGSEKMSKSLDNYIGVTDEPSDMYGKIMSIRDSSISNYFELCTYTPTERVAEIKQEVTEGKINPRDLKMDLARQIVSAYHGEGAATAAEADFIAKFQKKEIPDVIEEVTVPPGTLLADILLQKEIVPSKSEFRRLVDSGAVTDLDKGEKINDFQMTVTETITLKVGKHTFLRIKTS